MDVSFSINDYDSHGEINEINVRLHIDDLITLKFRNPNEVKDFMDKLAHMYPELKDTYFSNNRI